MKVISRHDQPSKRVRIGAPNEVEFTASEAACVARRDGWLAQDKSVREAAMMAVMAMLPSERTDEFIAYLSDGTLRLSPRAAIIVVGRREPKHRPILSPDLNAPRDNGCAS